MNKIFSILITILLLVSLTGCFGKATHAKATMKDVDASAQAGKSESAETSEKVDRTKSSELAKDIEHMEEFDLIY